MGSKKLGFRYTKAKDGYTEFSPINPDNKWENEVKDIRGDVSTIISKFPDMLMLRAVDKGVFVIIRKKIERRDDDFACAWIYVPNEIHITKELIDKLLEVKDKFLSPSNKYEEEDYKRLFEDSYETLPLFDENTVSRKDGKYAVRYYGTGYIYTLNELLRGLNQPEYGEYEYVFLIYKDKCEYDLVYNSDYVKDLSDNDLKRVTIVNPPDEANGFRAYYDNKLFDKPIRSYNGVRLHLEWLRDGYEPIPKDYKIEGDTSTDIYTPEPPSTKDFRKYIKRDFFKITNNDGELINDRDYFLKINGETLTDKISISEDCLAAVKVEIISDKYESCQETVNLKDDSRLRIKLTPKKHKYIFIIKDRYGRQLEIEHTYEFKLDSCPIEGYAVDTTNTPQETPNRNKLVYVGKTASKPDKESQKPSYESHKVSRKTRIDKNKHILIILAVLLGMAVGASVTYFVVHECSKKGSVESEIITEPMTGSETDENKNRNENEDEKNDKIETPEETPAKDKSHKDKSEDKNTDKNTDKNAGKNAGKVTEKPKDNGQDEMRL